MAVDSGGTSKSTWQKMSIDTQVKKEIKNQLEHGITVSKIPEITQALWGSFLDDTLRLKRDLVLCALSAFCAEEDKETWRIKCYEASSESGLLGVQMKKALGTKVAVSVNLSDEGKALQTETICKENQLQYDKNPCTQSEDGKDLQILHGDLLIALHLWQYNFVHISSENSLGHLLSSAFHRIAHGSLLVLSTTAVSTLSGKCPQVTLRFYGGNIARTDYVSELSVRILLASAARSAAQHNKGFDVLYSVNIDGLIQVAVRVKRRAMQADATIDCVQNVLHCLICGQWTCMPLSTTLSNNPYSRLPCCCRDDNPGLTAQSLGPAWGGDIFDSTFLESMSQCAVNLSVKKKCTNLISTLISEAKCPKLEKSRETEDANGKRKVQEDSLPSKKSKSDSPMFFYNYYKRHLKNTDAPKMSKLIEILHQEGYRASRTHFDPRGIRTNASLEQLKEVICSYKS